MSEKASVQTRARRGKTRAGAIGATFGRALLALLWAWAWGWAALGPLVCQRPVWLSACVLFDCGVATVSDGELDGYLSSEKAGRLQLALSSASWCE